MNQISKISNHQSIVLDFFRGSSAQLVLLGHLYSFFNFSELLPLPIIQNFGVLVFFILSGFLISQTSFTKGKSYGIKAYLIDRFSRIYYSFLPALVLVIFIDLIMIHYYNDYNVSFLFSIKNFFVNLFMLQSVPFANVLNIGAFGSARPFWTVAIEWWFYMFFGFLFYTVKFNTKKIYIKIALFIFSLILVLYYTNNAGKGLSLYWFLGFLLSIYFNLPDSYKVKLKKIQFTIIIVLLLSLLIYRTIFYKDMFDLGIAFIFSVILGLTFYAPFDLSHYPKIDKFSKFLASYSYSLYLVHYSLIVLFIIFFKGWNPYLSFIILFLLSNIISYIFYIFFEKKNYKLRTYLKIKFIVKNI